MQETYLKVWHRAVRFDPGRASPISWLCAVARNTAIDWCRLRRIGTEPLSSAADLQDEAPNAMLLLEEKEQRARIFDCLEELGGQPADAIRAAYFDGFTYAQLAERMAVPLGTMKSWVRRGLQQLKGCLGDG